MTTKQPESLRLAEMLTADEWPGNMTLVSYARECVAELLTQHAENETLRAGYAAARLEIESLKAQLHAAKKINAAQFGLLAASIPGSALRASHGQAPASVLHLVHSAFAEIAMAFPKAFALHKVGIADTAVREALTAPTTAQADRVQGDAERLDWLEQHDGRYYNLDKVAAIVGTGFLVRSEGNMPQVHSTLREAVYAARKQGASHDR